MALGNSPARAALMLLLLLELWLFTGSFDKFFNHDSVFYLIHTPRSFEDLKGIILAPDSAKQYRPLSLAFMGVVVPIFGLDPRPYHWLPVVFHLLNTVLFYRFARRFLADSMSVLAAVGFWGLHSVVTWITYDAACISDLLLATFFLSSILLAVDGLQRDSWLRMCGSLIL